MNHTFSLGNSLKWLWKWLARVWHTDATPDAISTLRSLLELERMGTYKSPRDKVTAVMNCCKIICS